MSDEELTVDDGMDGVEAPDGDFDSIEDMIEAVEAEGHDDRGDGGEHISDKAPTADEVDEELGIKPRAGGDDGGEDGDGGPKPTTSDSHARMVRKLAQRERELSDHRSALRDRDRQIVELQSRLQAQEPEDLMELVRGRVAKRLGVDAKDSRVDDALFELSKDMTLELMGDAALADPELKRLREERLSDRQRRQERRELESRIERMEREKAAAEQRAGTAEAIRMTGEFLKGNEARYPFFMGQGDVDPAETILELTADAIREGRVQVRRGETQDQAVGRIMDEFALSLDGHYRQLAETLSKKLPKRAGSAEDRIDEISRPTGKATKQAPQKRAGKTGTGGGGRGAPRSKDERDDEEEVDDLKSFIELMERKDRARGRR